MRIPYKELEKDIQFACCEYLTLKRYFFWRQNTTPVFRQDRNRFIAMPKFSMRGVPDIIIVLNGKFIGIEVKTKKGVQSDNQKEFQQNLESAGGEYYIVRSVSELQEIL